MTDDYLVILCHIEVFIALLSALVLNADYTEDDSGTSGTGSMAVILCVCAILPAVAAIAFVALQACIEATGAAETGDLEEASTHVVKVRPDSQSPTDPFAR